MTVIPQPFILAALAGSAPAEAMSDLKQVQRIIREDLRLARQVQEGIMPKTAPAFDGIAIALSYHTVDEVVFTYEPGDRFFIFTDGFYEIRREEERFLDYDCFTELLREFGKVPFNRIIPLLEERFSLYDHDDDATLIAFEVEDCGAAGEVESMPGAKGAA